MTTSGFDNLRIWSGFDQRKRWFDRRCGYF